MTISAVLVLCFAACLVVSVTAQDESSCQGEGCNWLPCTSAGLFVYPASDCTKYYQCIPLGRKDDNGNDMYKRIPYTCNTDLKFNDNIKRCDYAANVQCPPSAPPPPAVG